MKEICKYDDCTGCMACYNVCRHNAVLMVPNAEGFLQPEINQDKCVDCKLCYRVCPINKVIKVDLPIRAFSGWIKDNDLRMKSSSGGAFTALALPILHNKGVVFGSILNEKLKVEHSFIEKEEDLDLLRGSKYVQSDINFTYREVKRFLLSDKQVLFVGTPCQIAGLKSFLNHEYPLLITVDLICHGVPSPKIYEDWKSWFMSYYDLADIKSIKFRDKKKSWIFFNMFVTGHKNTGENFKYIGEYYNDPYIRGFLRDYFLRPSCHQCRYAKLSRCSDITIADWWGYQPDKNESNDYESKGVSLVLCNTDKGNDYFLKYCKDLMILRERAIEDACKTNKSLKEPFKVPITRRLFWKDYYNQSFDDIIKKYMQPEKLPMYIWLRVKMKPSLLRNLLCLILYKINKYIK